MAPSPMDRDEIDPITLKYQQSIPLTLLPASSHLAAFHLARLRPLANPSIQSSLQDSDSPFCLKCGSLYTHSGNTRIVRVHHKISNSKRERGRQQQSSHVNGKAKHERQDNYKDNVASKVSVEHGDAGGAPVTERVSRVLQRNCDVCGWVSRIPIPSQQQDMVASFPKKLEGSATELPTSSLPSPMQSESVTCTSTSKVLPKSSIKIPSPPAMPTSASMSRNKSRSKKSTLQDMLARNRKQEANRTQPSEPNNLTAFLTSIQ